MSSLSTLPKGDSAWLLRKSIQRIMQQVSVLETNIGSSTTGNSANTQVIFNDAGTLRGDAGLTYNKTTDLLSVGAATITGDLTVDTNTLYVNSSLNRVGIGTASPATILDIQSAGSVFARIQNTASSADAYLLVKNGTGEGFFGINATGPYIYTAGSLPITFTTATSERYRIASDGVATWSNVGGVAGTAMTLNATGLGVGTSPAYKFQVRTTSDGVCQFMQRGGGTHNPFFRVLFTDATATTTIDASSGAGNPILTLATGGSDRLIIDTTGNVGIGVTPSVQIGNYKSLQIGIGGNLIGRTDDAGIELSSNAYRSGSGSYIYLNTDNSASYRQYSGTHQWFTAPSGTAGTAITFTQAMTLDASGNLALGNGNLVMSTAGKGIDFSATTSGSGTMTSELLNDYEEGTWTPSLVFGGASVGMTGTFAGRYTKVGRAVTINGIIALTAKGSSTGLAKITGLPFVSANASAEYTAVSLRLDRVSFTDSPCGYIGSNVIVVELENITNAGTVTNLTEANFINTSVLIFNCTYSV